MAAASAPVFARQLAITVDGMPGIEFLVVMAIGLAVLLWCLAMMRQLNR